MIATAVLFAHTSLAAADDRESENVFWQSIQASTNPADFEAYLSQYKDGTYAALARNRLAQLKAQSQAKTSAITSGTECKGLDDIIPKVEQALISALVNERVARQEATSALADEHAARQAAASQLATIQKYATGLEQDLAKLREAPLGEQLASVQDYARKLEQDLTQQRQTAAGQIQQLTTQLVVLQGRLDKAAGDDAQKNAQITELSRRLREVPGQKVEELSQYRSEFFGRLRQALGDRPDIRVVGDRFVLQAEVLFPSGSASLDSGGEAKLREVAQTLREVTAKIPPDIDWVLRVDGHTDKQPVRNSSYGSNWELSTARANSVVQFLIREGIPANHLAAAGFAEFRPLDPSDDAIAYRRNRRIELKLTEG